MALPIPQNEIDNLISERVNLHAQKLAKKYKIRSDKFHVHLVKEIRGDDISGSNTLLVQCGPIANIYILQSEFSRINTLLKHAFEVIVKYPKIINPVEIVPYALVTNEKLRHERWKREKFGDISELIPDLLSRDRVTVRRSYRVEMRDKVTGLTITIDGDIGNKNIWALEHEARLALGHMILKLAIEPKSTALVPYELMRNTKRLMYER